MNAIAPIGHNGGPDLLDDAIGTDPEALELAEGILTGHPVESEAQMKAVDAIQKRLRAVKKAVTSAKDEAVKPFYVAYTSERDRFATVEKDLDTQIKGCADMCSTFKSKLVAEKAEAERKVREEAAAARRAAEEAARAASASDIEAQRAAAEAQRQAEEAQRRVVAASKDTVKGMRTVTRYDFTEADGDTPEGRRLALNWIAVNDRDALTAFIEEYARRHHKKKQIAGVRVWQEKEAF